MKKFLFFFCIFFLSIGKAYSTGNDLIICHDGSYSTGDLITVSDDSVYYTSTVNGEKKRCMMETKKIFMVKRTKGYDFYFDKYGRQRVMPSVAIKENDITLFLKEGKYFPIYNMTIDSDHVQYKMQDKKKAPLYMSTKDEILMILYADGTTTTFAKPQTENAKTREISKAEKALRETGIFISTDIIFKPGKAQLETNYTDEIMQIAEYMKYYPDAYIEVIGHTDNQGLNKINIPLSKQRAEAVIAQLVEEGIEKERLSATGRGASEPIADNSTEEGRAKNRRVEFRDLTFKATQVETNKDLNKPIIKEEQKTTTISSKKSLLITSPEAQAQPAALSNSGRGMIASAPVQTRFNPAPDLSPMEIETKVNEIDPYTLYRKGSVAEYACEYQGKQVKIMNQSIGPTYFNQIVADEKIENGLLVAYVRMEVLNKKHEPMKNIPSSFKELYFPTEIDTAGVFHFTHNPIKDGYKVKKRQGYGMIIPGKMQAGTNLQCSRMHDVAKGGFGDLVIDATYEDWQVMGEEKISTPAGTFDCMKLQGHLDFKTTEKMFTSDDYVIMWMARGIGVVRYEEYHKSDFSDEPLIYYLNNITIK